MKKRLRKKKHVGEFTEWYCEFNVHRNRTDGSDEFLDSFLEEAVGPNSVSFGGGCLDDSSLVMSVVLGYKQDTEARLARIRAWLDAHQDVAAYEVGELADAWHVWSDEW